MKPWAINDSSLLSGVYYNSIINSLAVVSNESWYIVGAKEYPLYGWIKIGEL